MPINYDEIVYAAQARCENIKKFAEALTEFQIAAGHMAVVFAAAKGVSDAFDKLDDEAIRTLGQRNVRVTHAYVSVLIDTHEMLDQETNDRGGTTYRQHINELLEQVK